ncbi:hypothetical protein FRC19_010145 [Serendipita sp. 401]|nr:hypothetical protein FRC19_010145 [Serendipita sp. 401]
MMGMETHEKWILGVISTSLLCAVVELGLSIGNVELGIYCRWTAPVAAGFTLIFHCVTLALWRDTTKKQNFTSPTTPSFIYSVAACVLSSLLAAFWLGVTCMFIVFVSLNHMDLQQEGRVVSWAGTAFSIVNMVLMWAEFGLVVHYRKQFFKRRQGILNLSQQQSDLQQQQLLQGPMTKKRRARLILWTILASLCLSITEICISLNDGSFGRYSLWLAPSGAVMTIVLHAVTLPMWKYRSKSRKGTQEPPFIYSSTICVLTGLLAVYWFISTAVAFGYTVTLETDPDSIMHDGRLHIIPWIEAALALVLAGLTFVEFRLVRDSRKYFLERVKAERHDMLSTQEATAAAPIQGA